MPLLAFFSIGAALYLVFRHMGVSGNGVVQGQFWAGGSTWGSGNSQYLQARALALRQHQFDMNLPIQTAQAIRNALSYEKNPDELRKYAASLRGEFPGAASMLDQKAGQMGVPPLVVSGFPPPPGVPSHPAFYQLYAGNANQVRADARQRARALHQALMNHGCRFYDEPFVREFQKSVGLPPHGFYDHPTRQVLVSFLGESQVPPPCMTPKGPLSPEFFWNPPGS